MLEMILNLGNGNSQFMSTSSARSSNSESLLEMTMLAARVDVGVRR